MTLLVIPNKLINDNLSPFCPVPTLTISFSLLINYISNSVTLFAIFCSFMEEAVRNQKIINTLGIKSNKGSC